MKTPKKPPISQDPNNDKSSFMEITDEMLSDTIRESDSPASEPDKHAIDWDELIFGSDKPMPELDKSIPEPDKPVLLSDRSGSGDTAGQSAKTAHESGKAIDQPGKSDQNSHNPLSNSVDATEEQKWIGFAERLSVFQNRQSQTDEYKIKSKDSKSVNHDSGPGETGPGDSGPGDSGPGDSGPGDSGPGDSGPADSSPGETDSVQPGSMIGPVSPVKNKKVKKHPVLKRTLLIAASLFLLGGLGFGAFFLAAANNIPDWDLATLDNLKVPSGIYDKDGNEIGRLSSTENRLSFKYEDLPSLLVQTLLAVEGESGGAPASQLAKKTLALNETSGGLFSSVRESLLTSQIESNFSPEEITAAYFSQIFFGHGAFGVRSAAQVYFGKEPADLTIPEIALLCGLPQAPAQDDPYIDPARAKERRSRTLAIMRDSNLITNEEYEKYQDEPFTFVESVKNGTAAINLGQESEIDYPYFINYVVSSLLSNDNYNLIENTNQDWQRNQDMADLIYNGGLHIYTTLDPKIQQAAEDAMKDPQNFPETKGDNRPVQGAAVILDNATGSVVAMVGGRETPQAQLYSYNRALGKRQLGSAAHPLIVYAPALEKGGFFAGTVLDDAPVTYDGWSPQNLKNRYSGLITMREALVNSVNIYAVKLYVEANPDYCWNFARINLGLGLKGNESSQLTNALGSFGATPLETARAYAAFANQGTLNEPLCITKITDSAATVLLEPEVLKSKAMKESSAYVLSDLMRSAVTNGTGKGAAFGNWYVCGKTGTTDLDPAQSGSRTGYQDAWFAGYSPVYTAAVWLGYDLTDGEHYLSTEYGDSKPADIWKQIMQKAHEGLPEQSSIARPANVVDIEFDAMSGLLPSSLTPAAFVKKEVGPSDGVPTQESDVWIELGVDPDYPTLLAMPGNPSVPKIFLALDRPYWAEKELPYKPPTQYSSGETIPAPSYNNPTYRNGTVTFTAPVTANASQQFDPSSVVAVVTVRGPNNRNETKQVAISAATPNVLTVDLTNGNTVSVERGQYTFEIYYKESASPRKGPTSTYNLTISVP